MKKNVLLIGIVLLTSVLFGYTFETGWYSLKWPDGSQDQIRVYPNNYLQWHVNGKPSSEILIYDWDPNSQSLNTFWRDGRAYATYNVIYIERGQLKSGKPAIWMYYYGQINQFLSYDYIGK